MMTSKMMFFKRRYFDMRLGAAQVGPFIQMANFVLLSFLWVNDVLPIEIFAPIAFIISIVLLSFIGTRFRTHQISVDHNMLFEKQTNFANVLKQIMESQKKIMIQNNIELDEEFKNKLKYLGDIVDEKI